MLCYDADSSKQKALVVKGVDQKGSMDQTSLKRESISQMPNSFPSFLTRQMIQRYLAMISGKTREVISFDCILDIERENETSVLYTRGKNIAYMSIMQCIIMYTKHIMIKLNTTYISANQRTSCAGSRTAINTALTCISIVRNGRSIFLYLIHIPEHRIQPN